MSVTPYYVGVLTSIEIEPPPQRGSMTTSPGRMPAILVVTKLGEEEGEQGGGGIRNVRQREGRRKEWEMREGEEEGMGDEGKGEGRNGKGRGAKETGEQKGIEGEKAVA